METGISTLFIYIAVFCFGPRRDEKIFTSKFGWEVSAAILEYKQHKTIKMLYVGKIPLQPTHAPLDFEY